METKTKQKVNKSKTPKGWQPKEWLKHQNWLDDFRGEIIKKIQKTKKTYKKFIK